MTHLTIEAIRENPWHAVYRELPTNPDRLLIAAAHLPASYCRHSEFQLMQAARDGCYAPDGYVPGPNSPDIHEEIETRWFDTDRRLAVLTELCSDPFD